MIPSHNRMDPRSGMMMGAPPPSEDPSAPLSSFLSAPNPYYEYHSDDYLYDSHHPHHHHQPLPDMIDGSGSMSISGSSSCSVQSSIAGTSTSSVDFDDPHIAELPRILLMGPRRGGKTSIQRVVFNNMSPHETLFRLEATQAVERAVINHTPLCRFTIWDFPGDYYGPSSSNTFAAHDPSLSSPHSPSDSYYAGFTNAAAPPNTTSTTPPDDHPPHHPSSDDSHIYTKATALIFVIDAQDEPYDHVLQNFTETVSRAIAANPTVAIEVFINKVDGELFLSDEAKYDCRRDIMRQVADELHDAGVPDVPIAYHLTSIYDHSIFEAFSRVVQKLIPQLPTLENLLNVLVSTCNMEKAYLFDVASKLYISTDSSPVDLQSVELCSDMIDVVLDVSGIYGMGGKRRLDANQGEDNHDELTSEEAALAPDDLGADSAYDSQSSSVIRLSNGMVLYLKEVDTMLALVCLTHSENFHKKSLINYNINCLKKALKMLVLPPNQEQEKESSQVLKE